MFTEEELKFLNYVLSKRLENQDLTLVEQEAFFPIKEKYGIVFINDLLDYEERLEQRRNIHTIPIYYANLETPSKDEEVTQSGSLIEQKSALRSKRRWENEIVASDSESGNKSFEEEVEKPTDKKPMPMKPTELQEIKLGKRVPFTEYSVRDISRKFLEDMAQSQERMKFWDKASNIPTGEGQPSLWGQWSGQARLFNNARAQPLTVRERNWRCPGRQVPETAFMTKEEIDEHRRKKRADRNKRYQDKLKKK